MSDNNQASGVTGPYGFPSGWPADVDSPKESYILAPANFLLAGKIIDSVHIILRALVYEANPGSSGDAQGYRGFVNIGGVGVDTYGANGFTAHGTNGWINVDSGDCLRPGGGLWVPTDFVALQGGFQSAWHHAAGPTPGDDPIVADLWGAITWHEAPTGGRGFIYPAVL